MTPAISGVVTLVVQLCFPSNECVQSTQVHLYCPVFQLQKYRQEDPGLATAKTTTMKMTSTS